MTWEEIGEISLRDLDLSVSDEENDRILILHNPEPEAGAPYGEPYVMIPTIVLVLPEVARKNLRELAWEIWRRWHERDVTLTLPDGEA